LKKISFIINPKSGTESKEGFPELIKSRMDATKYEVETFFTEHSGHATALTKSFVEQGVDMVVAVGGDGTVNEVARALRETPTALGIIPAGSGNGLARHLMLPSTPEGAIDIINEGIVHELDYGLINDHPFFCTCGVGFDAFISKKFAEAGKRGRITYLEKILKAGFQYESETYDISIDGGEYESYKAFLVSIANASQYGNDAYIAPQAPMNDGLLDIVIMEPLGILTAPQVGIDLMSKTINQSARTKCFQGKDIRIRRSKPGLIHYDGDPIETDADLHVVMRNKGIRVVVNAHADKRRRRPNFMQTTFSQFFNDIQVLQDETKNLIQNTLNF
jgi:YegS/Rv2252/BmrU family lipid kinase